VKNFIYLFQGQSDLIEKYMHLAGREDADAIFLTYDRPIAGAIFFPNSTWAQGRNKLLTTALNREEGYTYYIFCDDDIAFKKGDWKEFEKQLIKYSPSIAVPVCEKTEKTIIKGIKCQSFLFNDEQLIAFHHTVAKDGIILPYQEQFDDVHWWASCDVQQILIQTFYRFDSVQFNDIIVSNDCSTRYPWQAEGSKVYPKQIRAWLAAQFLRSYRDIRLPSKRNLPSILWRTFIFYLRHHLVKYTGSIPTYSIGEQDKRRILCQDSQLFNQSLAV
jgi:hypothetical protein